ncbi:MAG: flagellar basal body L-ring protein FlgH [Proteobacteria bacterium]|nr:flagellar basal body L-ring protein FlgH [Pseudomonadota bacterium]
MTSSPSAAGLRCLALAIVGALTLAGCTMVDRLAAVGNTPELEPIENPTLKSGYRPVSLPMPQPAIARFHANSLWRAGARTFFKDQRAHRIGDILTVLIQIDDDASVNNSTSRTRDNDEGASLGGFFGFETQLSKIFPEGIVPSNLIDFGSDSKSSGAGQIGRKEEINLRIAAVVTQVLPNGNLVIHGTQQVRVNFEVRELSVIGVVRREDIDSDNTVRHDQIAEARIIYGGRGTLSDVQQPRYGQEIFDIIYPF